MPGAGEITVAGEQLLSETEITRQTVEDVEPRTCRLWGARFQRVTATYGANCVRNKAIARPITAAYDVARPGCRHERISFLCEERLPIALCHKFSSGF